MKLSEKEPIATLQYQPPGDHPGYCPIVRGVAIGRYKHYLTACAQSNLVVPYDKLQRRGYFESEEWPKHDEEWPDDTMSGKKILTR